VQRAKTFQYGDVLLDDLIEYQNGGATEDQIAQKQIIKQAAALEIAGILVLKVAKEVNGLLTPLNAQELIAFKSYMAEVKDAGIQVEVYSYQADRIRATIDVYYDPSVLSATGARLDGSDTEPMRKAFERYLKNLEFNGVFVRSKLEDYCQAVTGVFATQATLIETRRYDVSTYSAIDVLHQPFAGYYNVDTLTFNYIAYQP
jgi:hypothetical protein